MSGDSCLYIGEIEHRRFSPRKNFFTYKVCYYFIDLKDIPQIFNIPLLVTYNRPGLLSFWRKDYLGDRSQSLDESIRSEVCSQTSTRPLGPIRLMTNISYFGFCFNPVSFYYCYNEDGETLEFIVSEITNTPWGEKHKQVFKISDQRVTTFKFSKDFHVSPFIPMEIDYTWVFRKPLQNLYVHMQDRIKGSHEILFDSTLNLKRRPLTRINMLLAFLKFPFITFKTMLAIYYQALKLFIKKVPFYSHPSRGGSL